MSISSGYDKFKVYHQTDDGSYKLTSRWTSSNTVELDDGSTVEEKFTETDSELGNKVDKVSGKGLSTNDYTTTEKNKLAGIASGAEVNQNAFSNVKVGSTTVVADSKTDTLTLAGNNVTLTPDATNDKITIAVADGSTSAKGVVQLTNSTSSTSTTTAATPSSVKSAYDLANTAKTTADNVQTQINKINGSQSLSTSILRKAEDLPTGIYHFILTGDGSIQGEIPEYSGNDVPDGYQNSSATIYKFYTVVDRITVELHGLYDFGNYRFLPPAFNYYCDGEWTGWKVVATESIS